MKRINTNTAYEHCQIEYSGELVGRSQDEIDYYVNFQHAIPKPLKYMFAGCSETPILTLAAWFKTIPRVSPTDSNPPQPLDFLHIGFLPGPYKNRNALHYKSVLVNILDPQSSISLTNKSYLYDFMNGRYMPRSYNINNIKHVPSGQIIIVKPDSGFAGRGIEIATNDRELKNAINTMRKKYNGRAQISQYIASPLTFDNHKFHLRVYMLATSWGTMSTTPIYRIALSKSPYTQSDWHNKDIHDTHFHGSPRTMVMPFETFPQLDFHQLHRNIRKIVNHIIKCASTNPTRSRDITLQPGTNDLTTFRAPNTSTYSYEIFGLDILFDTVGNPYLLEVNEDAGRGGYECDDNAIIMERYTCEWIYRWAIAPVHDPFTWATSLSDLVINFTLSEQSLPHTSDTRELSHRGQPRARVLLCDSVLHIGLFSDTAQAHELYVKYIFDAYSHITHYVHIHDTHANFGGFAELFGYSRDVAKSSEHVTAWHNEN